MAYPVLRFGTPKTPPHLHHSPDDSPRETIPHANDKSKSFKKYILSVAALGLLIIWMRSFKSAPRHGDRIPFTQDSVKDYFGLFEGHQDCSITSTDIYKPPIISKADPQKHTHYCENRARLLQAMSGGGRHGFDAPFVPATCHYRWYSTPEICMILERFDAVVFIGDDMLQHIYAAFNMLLRENLALGSLKQWQMSEAERDNCKCDNQIMKPECSKHAILNSEEVRKNDPGGGYTSPYHCDRAPHYILLIRSSPASEEQHALLATTLAKNPDSYKPVPIIHSLGLSTSFSWPAATASMDEWLAIADASLRNVPFLWLGPNAAGHLKPPGQIMGQGNNALWHYTIETTQEAKSREIDALGLYNLTLQASSWDGSYYAQRVVVIEAMMIINWLSRLETT